jgi:hypothetical protein
VAPCAIYVRAKRRARRAAENGRVTCRRLVIRLPGVLTTRITGLAVSRRPPTSTSLLEPWVPECSMDRQARREDRPQHGDQQALCESWHLRVPAWKSTQSTQSRSDPPSDMPAAHTASRCANDCVNAAGAFDYDFKTDVIARSRSTLGYRASAAPSVFETQSGCLVSILSQNVARRTSEWISSPEIHAFVTFRRLSSPAITTHA